MIRPRRLPGFINRIFIEDPNVEVVSVHRRTGGRLVLTVRLSSVSAFVHLSDEVELPLIMRKRTTGISRDTGENVCQYLLQWDVSDIRDKGSVTPFRFDGRGDAKRLRKEVTKQENRAANMIKGRRHAGSGSLSGLKSDASSDKWQLEAKSTKGKSVRIELGWLSKISGEASPHGKSPIVHLWFREVPDDIIVEDEWVMMPRSVFERATW